ADEGGGGPFEKVVRYSLPYQTVTVNGSICLPAYNASLFQSYTPPPKNSPIAPSDAILGPRRGMTIAGNQLIVKDVAALKIWNNYTTKSIGAVPDAIIRN